MAAQLNNYGIPNPESANLNELTQQQVVCYITQSVNEYNGNLGARISSIFVIGFVSTFFTFFPVVARRVPKLHIPLYVYLFARYFGSGVIVATAFTHLLDPAYSEIGPQTCVGLTGGWAEYSWPPAIALAAVMGIFVMDFAAERYVETKYGASHQENMEDVVTGRNRTRDEQPEAQTSTNGTNPLDAKSSDTAQRTDSTAITRTRSIVAARRQHVDRSHPDHLTSTAPTPHQTTTYEKRFQADDDTLFDSSSSSLDHHTEQARHFAVQQQLAAFLILEFGVIFHSVIIGLNLGVSGDEFSTLYVVLVFHQSFEGLGIGARMSAIPFRKGSWVPWLLCSAYGITTPLSIAIGLGVRTTYNSGSYTANVVSGVLDSISAGILIYTGLVELLARDFLFNPLRTNDSFRLGFMMFCVFLGAGIMALLGKWA